MLAWMLAIAMVWQSAGVETMAAAVSSTENIDTITDVSDDLEETLQIDENQKEDQKEDLSQDETQPGEEDSEKGLTSDETTDETPGESQDQEEKLPEEITTQESENEQIVTFEDETEEPTEDEPAFVLSAVTADGQTIEKNFPASELKEDDNPLQVAETYLNSDDGKEQFAGCDSYAVELQADMTSHAYNQDAEEDNIKLYLNGHTLTIQGDSTGSAGTFTSDVDGKSIAQKEDDEEGTLKFAAEADADDADTAETDTSAYELVLGAESEEESSLLWKNMHLQFEDLAVTIAADYAVTWETVQTEDLSLQKVTLQDSATFVTDATLSAADVELKEGSKITADAVEVTGTLTTAGGADDQTIPTVAITNSSVSSTITNIAGEGASVYLIAQDTAGISSWPKYTISGTVNANVILKKESAGKNVDYEPGDTIAVLNEKFADQKLSDYFVLYQDYADQLKSLNLELSEDTYELRLSETARDPKKKFWIYKATEENPTYTYQAGEDSLAAVKTYIQSDSDSNSEAAYRIMVNDKMLASGSTVSVGEKDLDYRDINSSVSLVLKGQILKAASANVVVTTTITGTAASSFVFAQTGTMYIFPQEEEAVWNNLTVDFQGKAGKLVLGRTKGTDGTPEQNSLRFENMTWKVEKAAVTVSGNVTVPQDLKAASLSVSGIELKGTSAARQQASMGSVTVTGSMSLNGELTVDKLVVGNTMTVVSSSVLSVKSYGQTKYLVVKGSGSSLESKEHFYLRTAVEAVGRKPFTITGSVSKSGTMAAPVYLQKWTADGGVQPYDLEDANKTIVSIPAQATAISGFFDTDQAIDACHLTWKAKNGVQLVSAAVKVKKGNVIKAYDSFEQALAGITTATTSNGFGSSKGTYEIILYGDVTMKATTTKDKTTTIPSCVTELHISSQQSGEAVVPYKLNLNKRTLISTASTVVIAENAELMNGTFSDGSAKEITLKRDCTDQVADSAIASFGNGLSVSAVNATLKVTATVADAAENTATLNLSQSSFDVAGYRLQAVKADGQKAADTEKPVVQFGSLALNSSTTTLDTTTIVRTLTLQGGSLAVEENARNTEETTENTLQATTVNVTKAALKDSMEGCQTIYNYEGSIAIGTLNMTAGTFYNSGDQGKTTITTVKRMKKLVNKDQAEFHVHSYASVTGDVVQLYDQSLFAVEPLKNGETETPGSIVLTGLTISGTPVIQKTLADSMTINGTPAQNGYDSRCTLKIVEPEKEVSAILKKTAFLTNPNAKTPGTFPVEYFNVTVDFQRDKDYAQENPTFMLEQNGKQVLIGKAVFALTRQDLSGQTDLGSFANWQQTAAEINRLNDTSAAYIIEVLDDAVTVSGTFTIPSKAKSLYFEYENEQKLCNLTWYGTMSLATNVTFHNFWLTPKASGKITASIALNGKTLNLNGTGGVITNVTGTSGSAWSITANPSATVPTGTESWVKVTGSVTGITSLKLTSGLEDIPTLQTAGNVTASTLTMEQADGQAAWLWAKGITNSKGAVTAGAITVTNIVTNGTGNKISYRGANQYSMLTVNGLVSSKDAQTTELGKDGIYYMQSAITVDPIDILAKAPKAGTKLLTAAKAPAAWFVIEKDGTKERTEKSGTSIVVASTTVPGVALMRGYAGTTSDYRSLDYKIYGFYRNVKEAFAQVTTLNDANAYYEVILLNSADNSSSTTSTAENLTFPSKAKSLWINTKTADQPATFAFKNLIDLNCNTTFENLQLVTPKTGGSIKPKNFALNFYKSNVQTGSKITAIAGAGKGQVNIYGTDITVSGSISGLSVLKVEELNAGNAGITVTGNASVATLNLGSTGSDAGSISVNVNGKLTVTNVVANHANCNVQSSVTLTRNKAGQITGATPNFTIGGTVKGNPLKISPVEVVSGKAWKLYLYDTTADTANGIRAYNWSTTYKNVSKTEDGTETKTYKDIPLVIAKKTAANMVVLDNSCVEAQTGMLFKSGGYIKYMSTSSYGIELYYKNTDGAQITPILSWGDAVTEINNLAAGNSNAKNQEYEIRLLKDQGTAADTTSVPMTLSMPGKNAAKNIKIVSSDENEVRNIYYRGAITANSSVTLENVALNQKYQVGKTKTWRCSSYYNTPLTITLTSGALYVGEQVRFNTPLTVKGSMALTRAMELKGALNVSGNLTLNQSSNLTAGSIIVGGNLTMKNAVLESAGTFTVNKNVTYTGADNLLITRRAVTAKDSAAKLTPYLTIKGTVSCTDTSANRPQITVQVREAKNVDGVSTLTIPYLAVSETGYTSAQKTAARRLLTAPKASVSYFKPYYAAEDGSNLTEDNGKPYEADAQNGYLLYRDKSGYVNVYYANEVFASVAVTAAGQQKPLGYYLNWTDMVNAVNAYKSSTLSSDQICVTLYKNVGGSLSADATAAPASLTLPTTKAAVQIESYGTEQKTLYYNNTLTLRANTTLKNIKLAPTATKTVTVNKKKQTVAYGLARDIALGSYRLTLDNVEVTGLSGAKIGNITGSTLQLAGNMNLSVGGAATITKLVLDKGASVEVAGKFTVSTLNPAANTITAGKSVFTIGSIVNTDLADGEVQPILRTWRAKKDKYGQENAQLTLNGGIDKGNVTIETYEYGKAAAPENLIDVSKYALTYRRSAGVAISVPSGKKLADVKKEYASHFDVKFQNAGTVETKGLDDLVKVNGGLYLAAAASENNQLHDYKVKLIQTDTQETSWCLDLNQAAVEINNLSNMKATYQVLIPDVADTCITDKVGNSALTLPSASKATSVQYVSAKESGTSKLTFLATGSTKSADIKPAGTVTFTSVQFDPTDGKATHAAVNPSVTMAVSTIDSKTKATVSALNLENCSFAERKDSKGNTGKAMFGAVTGVSGKTTMTLTKGSNIGIAGIAQKLYRLTIDQSELTTLGTVSTSLFTISDQAGAARWNAYGTVSIGSTMTVDFKKDDGDSYIGTRRSGSKSLFTAGGKVVTDGYVWMNVYKDNISSSSVLSAYRKSGDEQTAARKSLYRDTADTCKNIPLLIAPRADAGIFRAEVFRTNAPEDLISYKDLNYNVMNGNKSQMAIQIEKTGTGSEVDTTTYAKNFAQAVAMINRAGSGLSSSQYDSYVITLLNGTVFLTAQDKNSKAVRGALTLPTYAKSVTIKGAEGSTPTLQFTGAVTPGCNTTFENVKLVTDAYVNKKWVQQQPSVSMGNAAWSLTLPDGTTSYSTISAPKGTVVIPTQVTVSGNASVKTLKVKTDLTVKGTLAATELYAMSADTCVTGQKAMTFTNLKADGSASDAKLKLITYRTARTKKDSTSRTQLTINGEVELPVNLQPMVFKKSQLDGKPDATHAFAAADKSDYALDSSSKPSDNVKLAVIPKASLNKITLAGDTNASLWKYERGLYLAVDRYSKSNGGLPIVMTATENKNGVATEVYRTSFMNWAQAVKEIDVIAKKTRSYTIRLTESIGHNGSIGTLTMPAQAAKLTIQSNNEFGRNMYFTGSTITLRCPTEFDHIGLIGVAKKTSGSNVWYDKMSYTLNANGFALTMKDMLGGGNYGYGTNLQYRVYLQAAPAKIMGATKGTSKSTFTWIMDSKWTAESGRKIADQVTGFGTLKVQTTLDAAQISVPKGISGVGTLQIGQGVTLNASSGVVTVSNAQINGRLNSRGYTSTGTTTMHMGIIDAGMWVRNTATGAVKLNKLVLETMDNQIISRRSSANGTQLVISGDVVKSSNFDAVSHSDAVSEHAPLVICLRDYARNANTQLINNMVLLQAPKLTAQNANTLIAPLYTSSDISGMGTKADSYVVTLKKPAKTNNIVWTYESL